MVKLTILLEVEKMEESLEEFLKRDMNEQIEDLFFSNYMKEGQAIPTIKVKNIK